MESPAVALFQLHDFADALLQILGERQRAPGQPGKKLSLLDGADLEGASQPEGIHDRANLFIAVIHALNAVPHPVQTNPPGQFLVDRDIGQGDGFP